MLPKMYDLIPVLDVTSYKKFAESDGGVALDIIGSKKKITIKSLKIIILIIYDAWVVVVEDACFECTHCNGNLRMWRLSFLNRGLIKIRDRRHCWKFHLSRLNRPD